MHLPPLSGALGAPVVLVLQARKRLLECIGTGRPVGGVLLQACEDHGLGLAWDEEKLKHLETL
jgi:hypothetical protein